MDSQNENKPQNETLAAVYGTFAGLKTMSKGVRITIDVPDEGGYSAVAMNAFSIIRRDSSHPVILTIMNPDFAQNAEHPDVEFPEPDLNVTSEEMNPKVPPRDAPNVNSIKLPSTRAGEARSPEKKEKPRAMTDASMAAMLCQKSQFRRFLEQHYGYRKETLGPEGAANVVRALCRVESRSEFDSNEEARARWRQMYGDWQLWLQAV